MVDEIFGGNSRASNYESDPELSSLAQSQMQDLNSQITDGSQKIIKTLAFINVLKGTILVVIGIIVCKSHILS